MRVRLVEEKKGYARAELVEVLAPSPLRVPPRCAHFTDCGGCSYQHMPYQAQLDAKTRILHDQLERIGRIEDPPVHPAVPSPAEYHYRNNVQFHLTSDGNLGFHKPRSEEILAITECHLPEEPLDQLWKQLEIEPLAGLKRISLRSGSGEDIILILESEDPKPPEFAVEGLPVSAVYIGPEGSHLLAGSDHVFIEVAGRAFRVTAGSFFQINTQMAETMVEHLLANLPLHPSDTVIDAYAGVGLFSAFLAQRTARLIAIESSTTACDDFAFNLEEFEGVELYQARVEEALPLLDVHPQAILVDPPRAGLGRRALDGVLSLAPPVFAYISCDPATLARDARRLMEGGYRPRSITPFDLFPQTYHIESVSFWERGIPGV